jgi:putative protease
VTAYRLLLDAPQGEEKKYLSEAKKILSSSLGRRWSNGFRSKNSLKTLIQHESMGVSGLLCGTVKKLERNGFSVKVSKRLHVGDSIRIQPNSGDEGPAVTITKMTVDGRIAKKAQKNQECFIFCDKEMPVGKVFKIGESYDDMSSRIEKLPLLKNSLDIDVRIDKNGFNINGWSKKISVQTAEKRPLETETAKKEFTASRSDIFRAGKINVTIDGNLFLPSSVLKETRREFWEWADKNVNNKKKSKTLQMPPFKNKAKVQDVCAGKNGKKKCLKAVNIFSFTGKADEIILPPFCPQSELKNLKKRIDECINKGVRKFRVTSLYALELLRGCKDVSITASYPLPSANSFAAKELSNNGVKIIQAWIELEKNELEKLTKNSPTPVEIYRYGRPSVLSTRAEIPAEGMLKDSRGNAFKTIKDEAFEITHVYPEKVLSLPEIKGASSFFDLSHARDNERDVSLFNFDHELM